MITKLISLCLLTWLSITPVYAEETSLATYDLKIFDYKLGMTYDEAISVRAFQYTLYPGVNRAIGIINSVYMDDVEFNINVYFRDNNLFKIICRFNPQHLETVTQSLKKELGEGEDNSKAVHSITESLIIQTLCQWDFPGAKIYLVGMSNNSEFATLSMMVSNLAEIDPQP